MGGLNIGVNAIRMATQLIAVSGDNIANANTPGYHAKQASVEPVVGPTIGGIRIGLGASVEDVDRIRNALVESTLLTHIQLKARLGQENDLLEHLEALFAEPTDGGLDAQIGDFFSSISELAAQPDDLTLRESVVQKAQGLAETFRRLDTGFRALADTLVDDADSIVESINGLTERIAYLNGQIRVSESTGVSAPDLKDARDQLITELAGLINVTVHEGNFGVVSVSCAGSLLVSGNQSVPIRLLAEDGQLVVAATDSVGHRVPVREGQLAGVLEIANNLLPSCRAAVDELANTLRRCVNLVHTTALGLDGRFHSLAGSAAFLSDTPVCDLGYGVPAGTNEKLHINIEDEATGDVTLYEVTLDTTQAANAFILNLRDAINAAVPHLTAEVSQGRLLLTAEDGYAFGFATPYDPNPAGPGDITAADPTAPAIVGSYSGDADLVYEVSFLDDGEVGSDTISLQVQVREPAGPVLRTLTLQLDASYVPGTAIALDSGLSLTLSAGNVAAGDGFSFVARASMDTAGILDALGLNTLFDGLGAGSIRVSLRVAQDPANLAGSLTGAAGDNRSLLEMAALATARVSASGTVTMNEFYRALVGQLATAHNTRVVAYNNQAQLVKNLENRRDSASGVSVDEEMIKIIQSRTIYQGALKFISVWDELMGGLMDLL